MDGTTFDAVARRLASGLSRRQALRGLMAGALAAIGGGAALEAASAQTDAAGRRRCKRYGELCASSKQCCPKTTNRICRQPRNAGNSDTVCCGGEGAICGGKNNNGDDVKPYCCMGFECNKNTKTCRKS